jgi:chaperonin GroEL
VKSTRDALSALGGAGIPAEVVLAELPMVETLQEMFHCVDRRWPDALAQQRLPEKDQSNVPAVTLPPQPVPNLRGQLTEARQRQKRLADLENKGAQLLKEAAAKTNNVAAGGTTAIILAQAIVNGGLRAVVAGANPMLVKFGLDTGVGSLVAAIRSSATSITGVKEIVQVATVAAADPEIGNLIAEVTDEVGKGGAITVEESRGLRFETEYVEGMNFDQGYISPYFITNRDWMEAVLDEPYILITDKKISWAADIVPVLERALQQGRRDLLIIAEDVDGEALATLVVNKLRGTLNVLAVKAPGFGDCRKEILEDIAILTGGKVILDGSKHGLDQTQLTDLGRARRVISTEDGTTIIEGHGRASEIQARIKAINVQGEETTSDCDKEKLQKRLAKLSGRVAVIKVGGATEVKRKEKKHRVKDALWATRAAIEEGIVPAGGVALLNAAKALDGISIQVGEATGIQVLRRALEEPMRQIAADAGLDGSVVVSEVRRRQQEAGNNKIGYNAMTGDYVDLVQACIIDPAKVTQSAIENAVSIAGTILTTIDVPSSASA